MNSELNKIAGAVLSALLVIFGTKTAIEQANLPHGDYGEHKVVGYTLPKPDADGGEGDAAGDGAAKPEPAAFDAAKIAEAVASADAAAGEKLMRKCKACHTYEKDGANKVGPALWGIDGRAKAAVEGYKYSEALAQKGGEWTAEALVAFLHKPKEYVPGTKMVFAGFKSEKDLANIVAYLQTLK
ncbi:MAG: cytochrome c family protein [Filomicrobium sp.]